MSCKRWLAAGLAVVALSGCSSLVAPPYSADYEKIDQLKKTPLDKVAVATVQPNDVSAKVNKISLRAASMIGPKGTFAAYLEDALIQDLRELSVYDPNASVRIDATILKNEIDISGVSTGTGLMEVDVTVTRAGKSVLHKTYSAKTEFESSFIGGIAIPRGQAEYSVLVRRLLGSVYSDAAFVNALKK